MWAAQTRRYRRILLLAIPELFVPVLDDADLGGCCVGPVDRRYCQESLAVGRDVVPAAASGKKGRFKEHLRLPQSEALLC